MELRNDFIKITTDTQITFTDLKRGVVWTLDNETLLCDGDIMIFQSADIMNNVLTIKYDRCAFTFEIIYNYVEITMLVDNAHTVSMPSSFTTEGNLKYLLPIMQGMLWDCGGEPFESRRGEAGHHGFSMPMFSVLSEKGGYLYIAETMDNCHWIIGKGSQSRTWAYNAHTASLTCEWHVRKGRVYFVDSSVSKAAKTYREYVQEKKRFISFSEKIQKRPELTRLFGSIMCYLGYCQDDIDYVGNLKRLKDYGFDKALVYPVRFNTYSEDFLMGGQPPIDLSDDEIDDIKALGYDVAPWTWINEAIDDGSDEIRNMYRKTKDGNIRLSWQIDGFKYYNVCTTRMEEFYRKQRQGKFKNMTWDHFDVITCATNDECYAENHPAHPGKPLSKSEDREYIRKLLSAACELGGAVSSESFNDAYSLEYDLGSVKAWIQNDDHIFKPIPLTMLVYHDSIIHSWWEVHSYNSNYFDNDMKPFYKYGGGGYEIQATMDALYGCPPDVFPFGAQYGWTGNGKETMLYRFKFDDDETQRALKLALPVAKLHAEIGMMEMTDFTFLSDDYNLQKTTFEDGTRIYANFSPDTITHDECGSIPPLSWKKN